MILEALLVNVVPAVLELPPCKRVALDGRALLQQLQMRTLKPMVSAPAINHDITLQSLEGSVEWLNLQTLKWSACKPCAS